MRYTPHKLKEMATTALIDKHQGGTDYLFLIMTMCMRTGLDEREVERRIKQLSVDGTCDQ